MIPASALFHISTVSISRHKLRSFLAILGIIIGVSSVIVMIGFGQGAKKIIEEQVATLGTNLVYVVPGSVKRGGVSFGLGTKLTLTPEDAVAIQRECPSVLYTASGIKIPAQIIYKNKNWTVNVGGSDVHYPYIRNWHPAEGRFFTGQEVQRMEKVALLGATVVEKLFGHENPIGKEVRIVNVPFKVIGVMTPKGQSYTGKDQDDVVLMPYTTLQRRVMGADFITSIMASAVSEEAMEYAMEEMRLLLRERHKILPGMEDDFQIKTQTEIAQTAGAVSHVMTILLGSVALVSMIVGGIGIMNIMLVSITERTREIGIRMAVGAQKNDIVAQFLTESVVLCLFGGVIGVLLSALIVFSINTYTDWLVLFTPPAVILAFCFSLFVGVFFGFYPASKAASQNPAQALRYE